MYSLADRTRFDLSLHEADFTTAQRVAAAINRAFDGTIARARDGATLEINVPEALREDVVGFLARVEVIEVQPDRIARVVLNERTGTVVMGADVRIGRITRAVAFAAPVVVGIIDSAAARARRLSECGTSRRAWSFV